MLHSQQHRRAAAPRRRAQPERAFHHQPQGPGQLAGVGCEDEPGCGDIQPRHQRDEERRRFGDPLRAAQDHQRGAYPDHQPAAGPHHREAAAKQPHPAGAGRAEEDFGGVRDPADLRHRADAEHPGQRGTGRKGPAEPRPAQPFLHIIEGAAAHRAVGHPHAEAHSKEALGVFDRHPEEGGQPHPEQRAGPARQHADRRRHADNVPRADRGGKGGTQRLEGRDLALSAVVPCGKQPQRAREPPQLKPPQLPGQQHARRREQHKQRPTPQKVAHQHQSIHPFPLSAAVPAPPAAAAGRLGAASGTRRAAALLQFYKFVHIMERTLPAPEKFYA